MTLNARERAIFDALEERLRADPELDITIPTRLHIPGERVYRRRILWGLTALVAGVTGLLVSTSAHDTVGGLLAFTVLLSGSLLLAPTSQTSSVHP